MQPGIILGQEDAVVSEDIADAGEAAGFVDHDPLGEGLIDGEERDHVRAAGAGDEDLIGGGGGEIGFSGGDQLPGIGAFAGGFDIGGQAVVGEGSLDLSGVEAAEFGFGFPIQSE